MSREKKLRQGLLEITDAAEWLLRSRRWRLGRALGDLWARFRGQAAGPKPEARLREAIRRAERLAAAASSDPARPFPPVDTSSLTADIVLCVHDAVDDVKRCLESVARNTHARHRILVVDDASGADCAKALDEWVTANPPARLVRLPERVGYTHAANAGLRESTREYVVLLNSDTVVTPDWVEGLLEGGESDPKIGIIGPLSNAATWQSVPKVHDDDGEWAENPLPPGWNPDRLAAEIRRASRPRFPRVPIVNGFCFAIKKSAREAIGEFDEELFPDGYGEENDFCLRAAAAGFTGAVADHVYVYHATSKSYRHDRRRELSRRGAEALAARHGSEAVERAVDELRLSPELAEARETVRRVLDGAPLEPSPSADPPLAILFVLSAQGPGGGALSVLQEAAGLRRWGVDARVAVRREDAPSIRWSFDWIDGLDDLLLVVEDEDLPERAAGFDVVIATAWPTVWRVRSIVSAHPDVFPAYYVQDYEPWFHPEGSRARREAECSYEMIPGMLLFAMTDWLAETVEARHDVKVTRITASLDTRVFRPVVRRPGTEDGVVRIAAMIRPTTALRAPERTLAVLAALLEEPGPPVELHFFGAPEEEIRALRGGRTAIGTFHGVLTAPEVAALLARMDVFVDFSDYQAFGRTGLEAMACGCVPVLPVVGGATEYATHRVDSLLADTSSIPASLDAIRELRADGSLRRALRRAGIRRALDFSIERAVATELECLLGERSGFADRNGGSGRVTTRAARGKTADG